MNTNRVASLAGILSEKKWSDKVKAKWSPPEGFFSGSADEIVKGLLAAPGGHAKAMSRLNFYINRAGKKLSDADKTRLDKAKDSLSKKIEAMQEEAAAYAKRAGLLYEKKKFDDEDPDMDMGDEEAPADDKKDGEGGEETLPKIVLKIAKKAVGKSEEELADLLMKVYEAGHKDGMKEAKEASKDDKKSDKKDKEEVTEGVMNLSVAGSDLAADSWMKVRRKMVDHAIDHLEKELKVKGNEYNTHGPLNVAMILVEKFDKEDFEYSTKLTKLGEKVLRLLAASPAWKETKGYSSIVNKLSGLVGQAKKY